MNSWSWTNVSDQRFKKNIREEVYGVDFIKALRPVTYELDQASIKRWHAENFGLQEDGEVRQEQMESENPIIHSGFLAQEVEACAKTLSYEFSGVDAPKNDQDYYGLRHAEFVVPLVRLYKSSKK